MNCEGYIEAITSDPWDDTLTHGESCASCRAYRDELRALDRKIALALKVPVPAVEIPELPEVDTANVAALPSRRRLSTPAWLAIAATVVIAAALGFRMLDSGLTYPSLADEVIAHLDHEPYALRVTDRAVSEQRLQRVVPATVATLDHSAGLITYAQSCVINGKSVPHLVIQGERGPVTILLMSEETLDEPQLIDGQSINGVILPVGSGSIAIIGEKGEDLDRIRNTISKSVTWDT